MGLCLSSGEPCRMSAVSPQREPDTMNDTLELPPPGQATYADLEALPERYVG